MRLFQFKICFVETLYITSLLCFFSIMFNQAAFSFVDKVEGLEYVVRSLDPEPFGKFISTRYNVYVIYLENRSEKAFSIPGYSVDLGIKYATLQEVNSISMASGNKKLAALNLTAGVASLAFGGVAKSVASTAIRGISLRNKSPGISDDDVVLSPLKTYILYPSEALSLYVLVDNKISQVPSSLKFICHDEDSNINHIVINQEIKLLDHSLVAEKKFAKDVSAKIESTDENLIATPDSELYK